MSDDYQLTKKVFIIIKKFLKKILKINTISLDEDWGRRLFYKKVGLLNRAQNIETLVLGSSHGDYGFDSNLCENSYNMCYTSTDLYCCYELYKLFAFQMPNLKNIVLFYSVFSPGFELEKTNEYQIAVFFKLLFNIPYKERYYLKKFEKKFSNFLKSISEENVHNNYLGYDKLNIFFDEDYGALKRAKTHLRENLRGNDQTKYVEKILHLTKENRHDLIIVISPAREDYRNSLPEFDELFKDLNSIKNIKVLNFYNDNDFDNNDFGDFDHLNHNGAKKLTMKICEGLNNYEFN
jgi:hypothetical protein